MRTWIIATLLAFFVASANAQQASEPADTATAVDTIYIYNSWKSIVSHDPAAAYSGPIVYYNNELETEIFTSEPSSQQVVNDHAIAICVGDTLWLANTGYLGKAFAGKCEWMLNYIPLYFTEKIAFVKFWNDYPSEYYMRQMPGKQVEPVFTYDCQASFYILDFMGKRLVELNHKVLTSLLQRYPDLQCRYLAMKKYKEREVVDFFFMQYIERLKTDDDALTIVEQLNQQGK